MNMFALVSFIISFDNLFKINLYNEIAILKDILILRSLIHNMYLLSKIFLKLTLPLPVYEIVSLIKSTPSQHLFKMIFSSLICKNIRLFKLFTSQVKSFFWGFLLSLLCALTTFFVGCQHCSYLLEKKLFYIISINLLYLFFSLLFLPFHFICNILLMHRILKLFFLQLGLSFSL